MTAPAPAAHRAALRRKFRRLDGWMAHNLTADLSVRGLAQRALMSLRSFARHYREVMGITPAKAVERLRIDAATRLLAELSDAPVSAARVGYLVGYGCPKSFYRAFARQHGMSPDQWLELDARTSPGGDMTNEERQVYIESIIVSVNQRLIELQTFMDQQFERLPGELGRRLLERIDQRLDRIEERLDRQQLALDRLAGQSEGGGSAKTKAA
jgi:AraC-like DNA-binding protein